jgi:hypothetical protein
VIFALRHPVLLLGLILGFLVGVALRAEVQRRLARPGRVFGRRLNAVGGGHRPRVGWAGYLDPYGTVAAALGGVGWGPRPAARTGTSADWLLVVAALVVHGLLAALGFAAFVGVGGHLSDLHFANVSDIVRGNVGTGAAAQLITAGFAVENMGCGLLALVPIPPLELGVALWARIPRSPGARRVAYHVLEEQWGVAVVLLLLLLPIGGIAPPLLAVIDAAGGAVFGRF